MEKHSLLRCYFLNGIGEYEYFIKNETYMIAHLERDFTKVETKKDIPFWERRELWVSPFAPLLIVGFVLFGSSYAILMLLKWIIFSPIRPFTNSTWLCKQEFHKYRKIPGAPSSYSQLYECKVCNKTKLVEDYE